MCLLHLLLPMSESFYLGAAERRRFEERSVAAQKSLLNLLGNSVTKQANAAIARLASDATQSEARRADAATIIEATNVMRSVPLLGLSTKSYGELKDEQRMLFVRVSDEAPDESQRLRPTLRAKGRNRLTSSDPLGQQGSNDFRRRRRAVAGPRSPHRRCRGARS